MILKACGHFLVGTLNVLKTPYMGRVLKKFAPYKGRVVLILLLGLIISAIQPVSVKLSERIVNELQKGTSLDPKFFGWVPISLIIIFLVSGFAKYFHNTWRRFLAEEIIVKLRADLFEKYVSLPLSVLDKKKTGEMLSGLQNDLAQISSGIDTLCLVLKEPFTFFGLIGVAFYCDWRLTLCTLLVAPLVAYLFSRSGSAVKRYTSRNLEQFSDLVSLSQESLTGARIVKVFRLEKPLLDRFKEIQNRYLRTVWKSIRVQELATPAVELIGALLIAGVIVYGGYRTSLGLLTSGQLVAFIIAIGLAQMPIKQLNNAFLKLKTAEAAAERIYALLDTPNQPSAGFGLIRKDSFDDRIVFNNVSLTYEDKPVLHGISFEVKRGRSVALVGESGSGKTSIVNLLARLYEVSHGSILIDGKDIRDIYLEDLRGMISFVTQDVFLFNDTIYNNIKYGNPNASREAIEQAATLAHCSDFISRFPNGYLSRVGDRGVLLSGGERQRIAIARAFLKSAPILVLDEATSNLDSSSEAIVQAALNELIAGRTTFIVAHRLSTVRKADRILVIESGKIVEQGNHETLLTSQSRYAQFLAMQT